MFGRAVTQAVQRVMSGITQMLAGHNPLVLCVMGGAVVFSGQLLPQLKFPLDFDFLHLTRYACNARRQTRMDRVSARAVTGRVVLALDDILDEGHTMDEIRARMLAAGAAALLLCGIRR
jgi:hypoxanthine phosphoribosyltransferase